MVPISDDDGRWRAAMAAPSVIAVAAVLLLVGAVVLALGRSPAPAEIEHDLWMAWIGLSADGNERTFADLLFYREQGPAAAMLETLGTLTEKNGKRFVLPTQIRYAALILEGEEKPFAKWSSSLLSANYSFSTVSDGDVEEWTNREFPVLHPRTKDRLGTLQVSYQFYFNARAGLAVLPRVGRLKTQDLWLVTLVAVLAAVAVFAAAANVSRLRERAGRVAHQQATIELARQMCHELRNGLWAFSLEGKNLRHFFETTATYLSVEPTAFADAAAKAGLEPRVVDRIRRNVLRALAEAHADPTLEVDSSLRMAAESYTNIENFARYLQLTVEELDLHLLDRMAGRQPEALQLAEVWNESLQLMGMRLKTARIEVRNDVAADAVVWADRRDLIHVFVNMLKNAMEAMSAAPSPRTVEFTARRDGDWVAAEISNNGPMPTHEVLANFFRRGYSTKAQTGRGRGLHLIKTNVELAGGSVTARMGESAGVVFTLRIPAATPVLTDERSNLSNGLVHEANMPRQDAGPANDSAQPGSAKLSGELGV